jgi:hypothetical protein
MVAEFLGCLIGVTLRMRSLDRFEIKSFYMASGATIVLYENVEC